MSQLMGLDVGDKRVGVAFGTSVPKFAFEHGTFSRAGGEAEKEIIKLIKERAIEELIVGLPLSEDGALNEQCNKIEKFCRRIQRRCNVSLVFVDEYGTSSEAADRFKALGQRPPAKDDGGLDAASAKIILELYLNNPQVIVKRFMQGLET